MATHGTTFETGAYRDGQTDKLDYEGFLSPLVLKRYAEYMHKTRWQSNGKWRDSDNWQLGIPRESYMKSMWRHFMCVWDGHRKGQYHEEEICAIMFNAMGMLHETLKKNQRNEVMVSSQELEQRSDVKAPLETKGIPHEHLRKLSEMVETPKERGR